MSANNPSNIFHRDPALILRITVFIILIMHSVPGMLTGGVNAFGRLYLDPLGFAPFGLLIAWSIKISHVVCAGLILFKKYILASALVTIFILLMGIVMIHFREGWYVVGGGRNGVEFNVLLISVLTFLIFHHRGSQRGN